jgi:hypothetical protein
VDIADHRNLHGWSFIRKAALREVSDIIGNSDFAIPLIRRNG